MSSSPSPRRSARVVLLDEKGRVLLIRCATSHDGVALHFWMTPGGGVDPGESDQAAARRELREELGLDLSVRGPVHSAASQFWRDGVWMESSDVFFLSRVENATPVLKGVDDSEREIMREVRWWTIDELEQAAESVFPEDLASVLRRLAG